MEWLVEPLRALVLADPVLATCSGGATLNNCNWPFGLKTCDCSGGLVVKQPEQPNLR